ncbi:spermidine synthase [Cohnella hashimotonis]|uniref:Fused MFS/spermidine synthase n=1 Tax=Cohnella hashimotonis TaxID=2826895 RepID=A0ABT6TST8_9BACL|nr:fused MFS/spermidine synthase [Cohnella hashimotonis]MDI4649916.1 fused MFS/spermidine synthase [Cohnella hashimotonis]
MRRIAHEKGRYGELSISDTTELYGELGRFRILQFADGAVQGAIDLRDPSRVVLAYQRAIVGLMDAIRPHFTRAFVIGHGAGTIARHYGHMRIETAEINATVVEWSRAYFGCRQSDIAIGDGRELLCKTEPGSFDYIVVDAFTADGTPPHLSTLEFYSLARERLREGGTMLLNVIGRGKGDKRIASMLATLQAVFPYAAAVSVAGPGGEAGDNLILMAGPWETARVDMPQDCKRVAIEPGYVRRDRG